MTDQDEAAAPRPSNAMAASERTVGNKTKRHVTTDPPSDCRRRTLWVTGSPALLGVIEDQAGG